MAFRFQYYKAAQDKIATSYDDCFFRCPKADKEWDETRRDYCDDCIHRKVSEQFFTDTQATFRERFDEELSRGQFNKWRNLVNQVKAFEGTEIDIGIRHQHLLTAYLTEKDKYERATRPRGSS